MKTAKLFVLRLACVAEDVLVAWPLVLCVWLFWGTGLHWRQGALLAELKPFSWPVGGKVDPATGLLRNTRSARWSRGLVSWLWPRGFYLHNRAAALSGKEPPTSWGGTSVGHGVFTGPGRMAPRGETSELLEHEFHHVAQARAANVAAFGVALLLCALLFLLDSPAAALWTFVAVWSLGGNVAVSIGGWLAAWLASDPRGFYKGSAHEIGAYAVGHEYSRLLGRDPA